MIMEDHVADYDCISMIYLYIYTSIYVHICISLSLALSLWYQYLRYISLQYIYLCIHGYMHVHSLQTKLLHSSRDWRAVYVILPAFDQSCFRYTIPSQGRDLCRMYNQSTRRFFVLRIGNSDNIAFHCTRAAYKPTLPAIFWRMRAYDLSGNRGADTWAVFPA